MLKGKFAAIWYLVALIMLALAVVPSIHKVRAAANDNFDALYASLCQKSNYGGLVAYICGLRAENQNLTSQVHDLQEQVKDLRANVPTENVLFSDDFNGTQLDPNKWDAHPNGGNVTVSDGTLTLSSPTGGSPVVPPFIQIKENPNFTPFYPIPADPSHLSYEWRMKYSHLGPGSGMGLIFTTGNINPGQLDDPTTNNVQGLPFVVGVFGSELVFIFSQDSSHTVGTIPDDGNYHTYNPHSAV